MIGLIEQAIIDTLKSASDSGTLGYTLAKVATYGGEFTDPNLRQVIRSFPAVMVMFDGATKKRQTNGAVQIEARFGVFVATKNLRSEKDGRFGDGVNVGSYQIIGDIVQILSNNNLGLDIDDISFEEIRLILADKSDSDLASVYVIIFKTSFVTKTIPDPSSLDDFQTFHANWDIPVHGNVSTDLPADSSADATDHVEI